MIKTGFRQLSLETWATDAAIGREAKVYSNVSIDGRLAATGRQRAGIAHGTGRSGAAEATSPTLPEGRRAPTSFLPMRDVQCRGCVAELLTETANYINLRRKETQEGYIDGCLHQIIRAVAESVRAAGGLVESPR